mmetsp:Transcript_111320/g.314245  ORF Transcript_111320/g.314245 Transcript_111320/m.314245 type:complete len:215 (+) Transcript_111320:356-1000(+)
MLLEFRQTRKEGRALVLPRLELHIQLQHVRICLRERGPQAADLLVHAEDPAFQPNAMIVIVRLFWRLVVLRCGHHADANVGVRIASVSDRGRTLHNDASTPMPLPHRAHHLWPAPRYNLPWKRSAPFSTLVAVVVLHPWSAHEHSLLAGGERPQDAHPIVNKDRNAQCLDDRPLVETARYEENMILPTEKARLLEEPGFVKPLQRSFGHLPTCL